MLYGQKHPDQPFSGAAKSLRLGIFGRVLAFVLILAFLAGCSGKINTHAYRAGVQSGEIEPLRSELVDLTHDSSDLDLYLNLARLYQMEGDWQKSIQACNAAQDVLEEYENRAIYNIRQMTGTVGLFTLAIGSRGYYGAGYERSLLHTVNAINYLMLGDIDAAAVELRKMEFRQEQWLAEVEERLAKIVERDSFSTVESPDDMPMDQSLRTLLKDPSVQSLVNTYQDPFSYALSALVCDLAGDPQYASVSRGRAVALNSSAQLLFPPEDAKVRAPSKKTSAKAARPPTTEGATLAGDDGALISAVPSIMGEAALEAASALNASSSHVPSGRTPPDNALHAQASLEPLDQEVIIVTLTGLSPALTVKRRRVYAPGIGYAVIDFPGYVPAVSTAHDPSIQANGEELKAVPLLNTNALAHRTLWDEMRYETASAVSRAIVKAGVAYGVYAAASSNKDTRRYAPLIAYATTLLLNAFSTSYDDNLRNWELLPNRGYLTRAVLPAGSHISVAIDGTSQGLDLPLDKKTVIILVSYISRKHMRLDYVAL